MLTLLSFIPVYSSHNWNSLFLGANAVADVMAEKYGTSKSDLLNAVSRYQALNTIPLIYA